MAGPRADQNNTHQMQQIAPQSAMPAFSENLLYNVCIYTEIRRGVVFELHRKTMICAICKNGAEIRSLLCYKEMITQVYIRNGVDTKCSFCQENC